MHGMETQVLLSASLTLLLGGSPRQRIGWRYGGDRAGLQDCLPLYSQEATGGRQGVARLHEGCRAAMGAYSAVQNEVDAGAAEVVGGVGCDGSVKGAEDVIMAVYLADGYV